MSKKQFFKVTGFIGTLAAGTALVASAATGTGAWFTDSEAGSISANTGSLDVSLYSGHRDMNFQNLMPGDYQQDTVKYQVHQSSGTADVWLTFDANDPSVAAFTGAKGDSIYPDGGLGRYGHFLVKDGNGHVLFQSNNLAHRPSTDSTSQVCDADGSSAKPTAVTGTGSTTPYCGVPYSLKLASGLSNGDTGSITIEFGVTGWWANTDKGEVVNGLHMNETLPRVPFKIVATQAGHGPNDPNL